MKSPCPRRAPETLGLSGLALSRLGLSGLALSRLGLSARAFSSALALGGAVLVATAVSACGNTVIEESSGTAGSGGSAGNSTGGATTSSTPTGPHACTGTFTDCDALPEDGCETDLSTSSSHCGSCDHDCQGAACEGGMCAPEVLAASLYYANRLTLDDTKVYWTSSDNNLYALPFAGGTPTTFAGGQDEPWDIAKDAGGVYWTSGGSNTVQALFAGAPTPTLLADAGNPLGVIVRKGVLYYTDTYDKNSNFEHVVRVPLPSGPPQIVASTTGAWMVAADDEHIYWTDQADDAVWSAPALGGTPTQLASILDPADIEVDTDAVYVTGLEGTFRIPLAGGPPTPLVTGAGRGLAIDETHVFVGAADGRLLRVPKSGGPAVALSKADLYPEDIAVNADHVYWITRADSGALLRTPK